MDNPNKNNHGGSREGAGRKARFKDCSSKYIRVPDFLYPHIVSILDISAEWANDNLPEAERHELPKPVQTEQQRSETINFLKNMIAYEEERLRQYGKEAGACYQLDLFGLSDTSVSEAALTAASVNMESKKQAASKPYALELPADSELASDREMANFVKYCQLPGRLKTTVANARQVHFINANENRVLYSRCIENLGHIFWKKTTQNMLCGDTVFMFLAKLSGEMILYQLEVVDYAGPRDDMPYHRRLFLSDESYFCFEYKNKVAGLDHAILLQQGISRHTQYKILNKKQAKWLASQIESSSENPLNL